MLFLLAFLSLDYLLNAKSVPEEIMTGGGEGGKGGGGSLEMQKTERACAT